MTELQTAAIAEPSEAITRRRLFAGALASVFVIACGDDDAASENEAAATRRFTDSTGFTSEVPVRPQRIVAVGPPQWAAAQVLSLGLPIVGTSNFEGTVWPDYISTYFDMDGVAGLGWAQDTDIEAIAALKPDLIVAPARGRELEENVGIGIGTLRAIAPLVAIDPFRPVDAVIKDYVELLGVDATILERQQQEFAKLTASLRALLGDRWKDVTASNCWAGDGAVQAWGPRDLPMNAIIDSLGVKWAAPAVAAGAADGYADYALERLSEFEGDLLLYGNTYGDLKGNPLFDNLRVVRSGQVIPFPTFTYDGTHYPNYIACATYMLEQLKAMPALRTDIVS